MQSYCNPFGTAVGRNEVYMVGNRDRHEELEAQSYALKPFSLALLTLMDFCQTYLPH